MKREEIQLLYAQGIQFLPNKSKGGLLFSNHRSVYELQWVNCKLFLSNLEVLFTKLYDGSPAFIKLLVVKVGYRNKKCLGSGMYMKQTEF